MTDYVLQEGRRLVERQKTLSDLDMRFQESLGLKVSKRQMETGHRSIHSPRQTWGAEEFDLPDPIYSDGREIRSHPPESISDNRALISDYILPKR
jgi:hypothetical protein